MRPLAGHVVSISGQSVLPGIQSSLCPMAFESVHALGSTEPSHAFITGSP